MSEARVRSAAPVRSRVVRKIGLSLAAGAFAYLLTVVARQEPIWGLTMSVFIGGLVLVVQFLVDFERRLAMMQLTVADHTVQTRQVVRDGFSKINDVTELFSLVEKSALPTDVVTQLVRHAIQVDDSSPPLVLRRFAQTEIGRLSGLLKHLGEGGPITYEGEDREWLLTLARHAERCIDATSTTSVDAGRSGFIDDGLWTSHFGQRYLRAQAEAVARGVRIRRVFVQTGGGPDGLTDVQAVARPQLEAGIEVRVLDPAEVPRTLRDPLSDFVLFDDAVCYEVTPAAQVDPADRPAIRDTRVDLDRDLVRDRVARFETLWEYARPVPPDRTGPDPSAG